LAPQRPLEVAPRGGVVAAGSQALGALYEQPDIVGIGRERPVEVDRHGLRRSRPGSGGRWGGGGGGGRGGGRRRRGGRELCLVRQAVAPAIRRRSTRVRCGERFGLLD